MDIKDQLKDIPIDQVAERLDLGLQKHGGNPQRECTLPIQVGARATLIIHLTYPFPAKTTLGMPLTQPRERG